MIYIYQRHCITSSNSDHKKRPEWFTKEGAFDSLLGSLTLSNTPYHITCMLDGRKEDHFLGKKNGSLFELVEFQGGTENKSFLTTLDYILNRGHNPEDIIYILEDDYVHRTGWSDILVEGFREMNVDYITLYDHPDKYWSMYQGTRVNLIVTTSTHWRTTPSTTNTFACRYETLKKHEGIHRKHSTNDLGYTQDHAKFTELWTKMGSNLVSPIPGYSTHCEPEFIAPTVNWDEEQMKILEHPSLQVIPV